MAIFKGSGVAIITPFINDKINFEKLKELIKWHIENNTDSITICGTTGEATTMSEDERKEAIKFTVDTVNKRIPVIAGTGSNNTSSAISMSKYAESVGVDGLLVITPYYNKTNSQGLIAHFEAINNAVNVPIILYNVPSRTNVNITPQALLTLSKLENVVAIKEASGDMSQIALMKSLCKDSIDIYCGNDDQIVPMMALGSIGVISVVANVIPNVIHEMTTEFLNGNATKSLDLQLEYLDLINSLFIETNPIPVKTALNLMKKDVGNLRLPLFEMSTENKNALKDILTKYNLL